MSDTKYTHNRKGFVTRYGYMVGCSDVRKIKKWTIRIDKGEVFWYVSLTNKVGTVEANVITLTEARQVMVRLSKLARKDKEGSLLGLWVKAANVPSTSLITWAERDKS